MLLCLLNSNTYNSDFVNFFISSRAFSSYCCYYVADLLTSISLLYIQLLQILFIVFSDLFNYLGFPFFFSFNKKYIMIQNIFYYSLFHQYLYFKYIIYNLNNNNNMTKKKTPSFFINNKK